MPFPLGFSKSARFRRLLEDKMDAVNCSRSFAGTEVRALFRSECVLPLTRCDGSADLALGAKGDDSILLAM